MINTIELVICIICAIFITCLVLYFVLAMENTGFTNFSSLFKRLSKKSKDENLEINENNAINRTNKREYTCVCCGTKILPQVDDIFTFTENRLSDEPLGYIDNDIRYEVCVNCLYTLRYNGLINVPFSKDPGTFIKNEWGCFGRSFKEKSDLYKFMMKMDILVDTIYPNEDKVNLIYNDDFFDEKIDFIRNRKLKTPIDSNCFIKRSEIEDLLNNHFKNKQTCGCCGKTIFTRNNYEKGLQDILNDTSIDEITRYGRVYEYEKNEKDVEDKFNYYIDKNTDKLKICCKDCSSYFAYHNRSSIKTISLLKPVIYYDSVDQIKKLL